MEKNYQFIGKSVYLEKEKALVISDLHIGYEESLNIAMPRGQFNEIIRELSEIFDYLEEERKEVKEIIILGDLKHEFSRNIMQEWNEVRKFFSFLRDKVREEGKIILIKGNHDKFIESIASKYAVETRDYCIENDKAFLHGDKKIILDIDSVNNKQGASVNNKNKEDLINNKKIKRAFIGHFHPAIRLEEGVKSEIYKCFLRGDYKGKEIVILPSFFPLIEGVDVAKEALEESNLAYHFDLKNFEVYVPVSAKEVLDFGRVKDVRRLF